MKRSLVGMLLLALGFGASSSHALLVSSTNGAQAFSWSFTTPQPSTLSGTGSITWGGFTTTGRLALTVSLTNNALQGGQGGERLTAFGFGIEPNVTGATLSDDDSQGMTGASVVSNGSIKNIEVCAYGGQNCNGGGNGGVFGGGSDTFAILLAGLDRSLTQVTLNPFGYKYQTGYGSFEFNCTDSNCGNKAPEPASLALLGAVALGAGLARRTRRRIGR